MKRKIAIIHNALDNIGGAELVSLILARELDADIYTTNIDVSKINKMGFDTKRIFSIGKVPVNAPFRQQLSLLKFRRLNLRNKYDFFIISGDWAVSASVHNKPNIWYTHSAVREIFDFSNFVKEKMIPKHLTHFFDIWAKINRRLVRNYVGHVDRIICNSNNTLKRVNKYLKKEAKVIYPPVETQKYFSAKSKNYWLSVNRLLPTKRIEMQIKAFSMLKDENLMIVGSYEKASHFLKYVEYLKKMKINNVKMLNWVDSKELIKLYSECKGFITTSKEEDFGMNAVEALASGKYVIAPNEGGYKESIINGNTGVLINEINHEKIIKEINKFSSIIKKNPNKFIKNCQKQAKKFNYKIFIDKIKKELELI